ncbi:MAG: hypothetical protein AAB785_02480, partial [Patescibacteria group bacterium]
MFVLAPSNPDQLSDRAGWFKKPIARKLAQEKGVEFGFELKGTPEKITKAPPLFWGYHLPDDLASEWYYHPENRVSLLSHISHLSKLNPHYLVIHGIHLWRRESAQKYLHRYQNRSTPAEYLKVLEANVELLRDLKKIFGQRLKIENYPLYMYYQKDGRYIPETYLYTGSGRLNDLLYICQKAKVGIVLDLEHLILTLNFLNRKKNYSQIPVEKKDKLTSEEKKLQKIFGFNLAKNSYPYADLPIDIKDFIKKAGAKIYHLTGSTQDVIPGKKVVTHAPIKSNDKIFRKHLRMVLAQKPEVLVLESASSTDNPAWSYL